MRFGEHTNSRGDCEPTRHLRVNRSHSLAGAYFARLNPLQSVESLKAYYPTMETIFKQTGSLLHCETVPIGNCVTDILNAQLADGFYLP